MPNDESARLIASGGLSPESRALIDRAEKALAVSHEMAEEARRLAEECQTRVRPFSPARESSMTALDDFRGRSDQIERSPHDAGAYWQLVREICVYPWKTLDERNAAQALVYRLDRLRRETGSR
jgi:hypothetical protein